MFFTGTADAAKSGNLYPVFSRKSVVKVHVSPIVDSSEASGADLLDLKATLESALANRRSIKFEIVNAPEAADIQIDLAVTEYLWTDKDPVDMITSAPLAVYDVLTEENYARLRADIKVTDVASGKALWTDHVKSTISDVNMTPEESLHRVNEELVGHFIRLCFGKKQT
jgi:hypothetical protein